MSKSQGSVLLSQRTSSSTGTTPIHMRIRPFLCPSSAEGPARRQNPSPVFYPIMRGCLCSCERVPAGPGWSAATDPRAPGPSWIESLSRLLSLQVTQDVLELDVQTCLTISSREALPKFFCTETRNPP